MKILILLITFLLSSIAFSDESKRSTIFTGINIPVVCADPEEIDPLYQHKGFIVFRTLISISYEQKRIYEKIIDGKVVYIVVYYLNRK